MGRKVCTAIASLCLSSLFVAGCSPDHRGDQTAPSSPSELRQMVVGEAANGLSASGLFSLATPAEPQGELPAAEALRLAAAWPKQFGRFIRPRLEQQHGARIDVDRLTPCGPPFYAASSFQPFPTSAFRGARFAFGSWWIVGLCDAGGAPTLSVAVAAGATDLRETDGRIVFPAASGAEFVVLGIPASWEGALPFTPENAAERGGALARRRISRVPQLWAPDPRHAPPQGALWQITLETPAVLKGTRSNRVTSFGELYVGADTLSPGIGNGARVRVSVPTAEQPTTIPFRYPSNFGAQIGKRKGTVQTTIANGAALTRPDVPVDLEPAVDPEAQ